MANPAPEPETTAWLAQASAELKGQPVQHLQRRLASGFVQQPVYSLLATHQPVASVPGFVASARVRANTPLGLAACFETVYRAGCQRLYIGANGSEPQLPYLLATATAEKQRPPVVVELNSREALQLVQQPVPNGLQALQVALLAPDCEALQTGYWPATDYTEAWHSLQHWGQAIPGFRVWAGIWPGALAAGALPQTELAVVLASVRALLQVLPQAAAHLHVRLGFGTEVPTTVAQFRAARTLLQPYLSPTGGTVHAQGTTLFFARTTPHNNLVRATLGALGAVLGTADAVSLPAYAPDPDEPEAALRWSLNILHLLQHEAHLARVADATAGAGLTHQLTEYLAQAAPEIVSAWPDAGTYRQAILEGHIQQRVRMERTEQIEALRTGRVHIVGETKYRPTATPAGKAEVPAAHSVAFGPATPVERLEPVTLIDWL
jgi:hypothetical protein